MSVELGFVDDVAVMRLNRPQAMNALNRQMIEQIGERLDEVAASDARALIVVGEGGKAFSAGADVKELLGKDADEQRATSRRGQLAFAKLDNLPISSVAVITGFAFGGGMELALACTFRIATANSRFGLPEIRLGLIPGYGGTQRLPRLVGLAKATEIVVGGRTIGAEEAERIGMVHRIVDATDPVQAGREYLTELGAPFPASLKHALEATRASLGVPLEQGLALEADLFSTATQTGDAAEGLKAFLDKRKAAFVGR